MRQGVKPVVTGGGRTGRHWMGRTFNLLLQEEVELGGIG